MSSCSETLDLAPLDKVLEEMEGRKGALIPILQRAQELYGFLPCKVLEHIAKKTCTPLNQVYGVVTFYAQFYLEKRGRHVLMHKPIANRLYEGRLVIEPARKTGKQTHLLAYGSGTGNGRIAEAVKQGTIGLLREIHCWANRPVTFSPALPIFFSTISSIGRP